MADAADLQLSAREAYSKAKEVGPGERARAVDHNYNLEIKRVMAMIRAAMNKGKVQIAYSVPWLVMDGTSANQVLLARQIKKRLEQLGYFVRRRNFDLYIDWDLELRQKEEELKRKKEEELKRKSAEEKKALRDAQRLANFGTRPARKLHPPLARRIRQSEQSTKRRQPARSKQIVVNPPKPPPVVTFTRKRRKKKSRA